MRAKTSQIEEWSTLHGYFKFNLPASTSEDESGNGEGMWAVCADIQNSDLAHSEKVGDIDREFDVYLANDSVYYPHLTYGTKVRGRVRGPGRRPTAILEECGSFEAQRNRQRILEKLCAGTSPKLKK